MNGKGKKRKKEGRKMEEKKATTKKEKIFIGYLRGGNPGLFITKMKWTIWKIGFRASVVFFNHMGYVRQNVFPLEKRDIPKMGRETKNLLCF
jgi:hypothetical protein